MEHLNTNQLRVRWCCVGLCTFPRLHHFLKLAHANDDTYVYFHFGYFLHGYLLLDGDVLMYNIWNGVLL